MGMTGAARRRALLCSCVYYWWYFALGATISSLGSLLPGIGRQTGATLEQQKWLVPPRATGFGVGFGRHPQSGKIVISRLRPGGNAGKTVVYANFLDDTEYVFSKKKSPALPNFLLLTYIK